MQEKPPNEPWMITFRISEDDVRTIHRLVSRTRRRLVFAHIVGAFFASGGAGLGFLLAPAVGNSRYLSAAVGAGLGAAIIIWLVARTETSAVKVTREAGGFDEQTLTIDAWGFHQRFEDGRSFSWPWTRARRVAKNSELFCIMMNKEQAIIVPVAAFRSESYAYLFASMAYGWHAKAAKEAVTAP
jgi:hypothetical protein